MKNKIIPYNPDLKERARQLRKNSTLPEVLLWQHIKQRAYDVAFLRFSNDEVKKNMFSVLLVIEEKVGELLGKHP
ncbi:hypothetical protein ITJ86_08335 [Winogradskyella sp. F6397]|uniref:DUF559 domain-containing protein n=1 Tax=Winogradskyella marina TaxID=2785530 RepID=A0ABS0EHM5_9FLAO|nr:hypothetical protein [Winogradskyella marina]MBF8149904.1 hypothetical protein [Winogradskyella marina]